MDVAEDPHDDSLMSFHHPSPVDITEAGHHTRQVSSTLSSVKRCFIDGHHYVYQRLRVLYHDDVLNPELPRKEHSSICR